MKKIFIILFLTATLVNVFSHIHWIDVDNFNPELNDKIEIMICSGHYFPKSSFALNEKLICETKLFDEIGEKFYTVISSEKYLIGNFIFADDETKLITFQLKKPQMKDPLFWAKSIIYGCNDSGNYLLGKGLEITPLSKISLINKNDKLPLKITFNGKPVQTSLAVSIDGKKNFFLKINKEGMGYLNVKKVGKYLLSCENNGKECSLTFFIKDFEDKK